MQALGELQAYLNSPSSTARSLDTVMPGLSRTSKRLTVNRHELRPSRSMKLCCVMRIHCYRQGLFPKQKSGLVGVGRYANLSQTASVRVPKSGSFSRNALSGNPVGGRAISIGGAGMGSALWVFFEGNVSARSPGLWQSPDSCRSYCSQRRPALWNSLFIDLREGALRWEGQARAHRSMISKMVTSSGSLSNLQRSSLDDPRIRFRQQAHRGY